MSKVLDFDSFNFTLFLSHLEQYVSLFEYLPIMYNTILFPLSLNNKMYIFYQIEEDKKEKF